MAEVHKPTASLISGLFTSSTSIPFKPWMRVLLAILWLVTGAISVYIAISTLQDMPFLQGILEPFKSYIPGEKAKYSPLAYFFLLSATAFLEWRIPVRKQPILSVSLVQDALWYIGTLVMRITFLAAYTAFLFNVYHQHLAGLTIETASNWHPIVRFIVALLVTDFFRWLSHLLIHKVPAFWVFHEVHHSQTELNIFTDARVHPVDRMISGTIKFIPMLMLDNALPIIMAWAVFETIYPKFYHANVRISLGPLRYLLVTPQSHRIHHGIGPTYHDKNFGFTFSIWDRMFGTQHHDHEDYPETGILDHDFPLEQGIRPATLLKIFYLQLIYPFKKLLRLLRH